MFNVNYSYKSQASGIPRGWEHYSRAATDKQAEFLLERAMSNGVNTVAGIYSRKPDARPENMSHAAMLYYKKDGEYKAALEFSEHLQDGKTGKRMMRSGEMPVYGRYTVSTEQLDNYARSHPDKRESLANMLNRFNEADSSYVVLGEPPNSRYFSSVDCGLGVRGLNFRSVGSGKLLPSEQVERASSVLEEARRAAVRHFESQIPRHRIMFEMRKIPGAFEAAPIKPFSEVDEARVEDMTGCKMENGTYKDGYQIVAQWALDETGGKGQRFAPRAMQDAYLATVRVGKKVDHSFIVTPDLACNLMEASHFERDGMTIRGVTECAVYPSSHPGAIRTVPTDNAVKDPSHDDVVGQNRTHSSIMSVGERPPKGCILVPDLRGPVAGEELPGCPRKPARPLDFAAHKRMAAIKRSAYMKTHSVQEARGHAANMRQAGDIQNGIEL